MKIKNTELQKQLLVLLKAMIEMELLLQIIFSPLMIFGVASWFRIKLHHTNNVERKNPIAKKGIKARLCFLRSKNIRIVRQLVISIDTLN
ncbi:conserved hypothetical protein [Oenococcus oeni]|nr:conserved hypothetical protein [Oenococcus oeni]SYW11568.1 conserved hypothetical protein [Oenococcus oeni]